MATPRVPSASTVPFTPRPQRKPSGSKFISKSELNQIATTLASVRKVRPQAIVEELDSPGDFAVPVQAARPRSRGTEQPRAASARSGQPSRAPSIPSSSRAPSASSSRPLPPNDDTWQQRNGKLPSSSASIVSDKAAGKEKAKDREIVVRITRDVDGNILDNSEENLEQERKLDGVPRAVQEAWMCEDMMFVLQGVEGELIRYDPEYDPADESSRLQGAKWRIDPSLDPSLLSLVERLLPLTTAYTAVEAFMDLRNDPENGMVSHALASGIRSMLKEYRVLTAQLESLYLSSATFALQTLYFHLHPTLHTMTLLSSLCQALETEDAGPVDADSDDDGLGGMAEQLGGAGLKALMKNLNTDVGSPAGPVVGGEVLGIICEREATMSGDPTASTLHSQLLQHASQPYSRILLRWILSGHLDDPFDEFMVKASGHITKGVLESDYTDEYWERRYTLRDGSSLASSSKVSSSRSAPAISAGIPGPRKGTSRLPGGACVPTFLQPWKQKILLAGKYLNVIRECGIEVQRADGAVGEDEGDITINEPRFYKRIEDAYIHANKTLLKLMLDEQELIPHLRSMKHFFFLDQSDFLTNFLDLAGSELKRSAKSVSLIKLQSLLDLAIRNPSSSSSSDPYKDNLKVTVQSQGLYEWLLKIVSRTGGLTEDGELDLAVGDFDDEAPGRTGDREKPILAIDGLALDYSVKFPLSLIISRKTVTRYQLIFRFLLHLHHLESALGTMWVEHKSDMWRKHCGNEDVERWKYRIFSLRNRMLSFVRQVLAFATGEVLQTQWRTLEAKLEKVQTVDQLLRDHVDFLDTCLKQCMLTTSKLLRVYAKLTETIAAFANYQPSLNAALSKYMADPLTESDATKAKQRWDVLSRFEVVFTHHSKVHLDAVTYNAGSENVALLALVTRLHQATVQL